MLNLNENDLQWDSILGVTDAAGGRGSVGESYVIIKNGKLTQYVQVQIISVKIYDELSKYLLLNIHMK